MDVESFFRNITAKSISVLFFLFFCRLFAAAASDNAVTAADSSSLFDSTALYRPEKHYLTAFSSVAVENAIVMSWNKYVSRAGWADVTLDDVKNFYKKKPEFDTDWFWTNFVLHPYQGALAYMCARAANLNMAESFGIAALQSATWEYFCETNTPSTNDLVYSSVGAFPVGEMLYRLSFEVDPYSRFWNSIVCPSRLYVQLLTGDAARGSSGHLYSCNLRFSIGTALDNVWYKLENTCGTTICCYPFFMEPELNFTYNNPYGWDSNVPYSQFSLKIAGGLGPGSHTGYGVQKDLFYDVRIISSGMLFSRAPDWGSNRDTTVGISMDYDFVMDAFAEFSVLAPGLAIKQKIYAGNRIFTWQARIEGILLGTSDYYFFFDDIIPRSLSGTRRDYSYTTGSEGVFICSLNTVKHNRFSADVHIYAMYAFPQQIQNDPGDRSGWDIVSPIEISAEHFVTDSLSLGIGSRIYFKRGIYEDAASETHTACVTGLFARIGKTGR